MVCAIAQVVSCRLPTATARVRPRVRSCGICGGQSGTGAGFLRVLWILLPIRIPPIAPQSSSSIIWGWYHRPVVAAVENGLSVTPWERKKKCLKMMVAFESLEVWRPSQHQNFWNFSSHFTVKTLLLHYKYKPLLRETIVGCENYTTHASKIAE
jgi:hypothetical protein